MVRSIKIALFSATMLVAACKKADKPADTKPEETTKAADPAKPADPAAKPTAVAASTDPAAVAPADPAVAPAAAGSNSPLEIKGLAMMQKMADLFVSDEKDCEKLAVDLKAFVASNRPLLSELTALEKKQTDADRAAFEARNKEVQDAVEAKMNPAVTKCSENKNVQAAMKEFPTD